MVAIASISREFEPDDAARRVLVVDDDRDAADSVGELLASDGYAVKATYDASGAVEFLATFDPAVALIDIRLGRANGLDLAADLKRRRPDLICLMITAYAATDSAVEALRAGADDFLRKPVRPEELFAALERAFAKRQLLLDKQAAEAALREREQRHRELLEQSPVGLWEEDWSEIKRMLDRLAADGVEDWRDYFESHPEQVAAAYDLAIVVDVSQATLDLYNAPDIAAAANMSTSAFVTPEALEAFRDSRVFFLEGGKRFDVDVRELRADGEDVIIRERVVIPRIDAQDWSRVIYAIEDITERRRAEDALRDSQEQIQGIAANLPGAIYRRVLEPDGSVHYPFLSEGYEAALGFSPDKFVADGTALADYLSPEHFERWSEAVRRSAEKLEPYDIELLIRAPGSEPKWVRTLARPRRLAGGAVEWDGIVLDIAEQKEAEEALGESREQIRSIAANLPGAIYRRVLEPDGSVHYPFMSEGYEAFFGFSPDKFVANGAALADYLSPEHFERWTEAVRHSAKSSNPTTSKFSSISRAASPSGCARSPTRNASPAALSNGTASPSTSPSRNGPKRRSARARRGWPRRTVSPRWVIGRGMSMAEQKGTTVAV